MNTEELVIDDGIMEELREISERKGRSLEETIKKYAFAFGEINGYDVLTTNFLNSEEFEDQPEETEEDDSGVLAIDYFGPYVLEEILEDEEMMEDIRKESAQTGECPMAIAQRFVDSMNELMSKSKSKISPALLELWQYYDSSEAQKEEYKKVV